MFSVTSMVTTKKQLLEITQKSNKIISLSPQKKKLYTKKDGKR